MSTMQPGYRQYPTQQMPPQRASHGGPRRGGIGPMMSQGPHHSVPLTQTQIAQQQQQAAIQVEMAKRRSRKPTDKNLPEDIDGCVIGDIGQRYRDLRRFERELDATMTKKRLDMVDSVTRNSKRWQTLRIWISNTVEDQVWQGSGLNVDTFDFSSNLEPTYRVKIQGRLLDDEDGNGTDDNNDNDTEGSSEPQQQKHRFSHFFKAITVDFPADRKGLDQNVEWRKLERTGSSANLPAASGFDELCFKRSGDENMNITFNLHRHEDPERYAVSPELQDIVDRSEATRQDVVMALWDYIKLMGLQEDDEKRTFRCDELMSKAFNMEKGTIPSLNLYVNPHLKPLPPVQLTYTIRVDEAFHKDPHPTVYDIRVPVDELLREKMLAFLNNSNYAIKLKEVASMDDQLGLLVQAIQVSKAKHDFLSSLAADPATFIKDWLSSQNRDLDVIMGEAVRGAGTETSGDEWRRGGRESVWNTVNARESVSVMLNKPPVMR